MLGERYCFELLKSCLKYAASKKPDYAEFLLLGWDSSVTRVANSQIHQNVSETEASLAIEIVHNLRIGSASTNLLTENSIQKTFDMAFDSTKHKAQLSAAPKIDQVAYGTIKGKFSDKTASFTPNSRARLLKDLIDQASEQNLITSAKFHTGAGEIAFGSSLGSLAYTSFTDANLSVILTGSFDSSYASTAAADVSEIDVSRFGQDLLAKCRLQNRTPVDLFSSRTNSEELYMDVILEPAATAEWINFLSYCGFNGLSYHEEESFLCGKLGTKVMKENVTIWDDGNDPAGYVLPFDFEGTSKSKIFFIENGVARNVAYDGLLAAKENTRSTGHSLGAGQRHHGAMPLNLFMEGGEQSIDYMIASSEEPTLYITRFHYTNIADRKNVVLTGTTKDGTFLVEKGEIVAPAVNLRYLQGIVDAFQRIEMLSDPVLVHDPDGYGALLPSCSVVPAIRIQKVRFIGSTAGE